LREWVRQFVGLDLQWDVELCLARAEVPEPLLRERPQLGRSAWLGSRSRDRHVSDRRDLRLQPEGLHANARTGALS
jgi:type VI secretion system protein ImpH